MIYSGLSIEFIYMQGKKHVVLAGLNFHPAKSTGDKNFWVDLIPEAATGLDRITIISIRNEQEKTQRMQIHNCQVCVHYLFPQFLEQSDGFFHRTGTFPFLRWIVVKFVIIKQIIKMLADIYAEAPFHQIHLMDNFGFTNRRIARWAARLGIRVAVSAMAYMGKLPLLLYHAYLLISYNSRRLTVVPYSRLYSSKLLQLGIKKQNICYIPWGVWPADNGNDAAAVSSRPSFLSSDPGNRASVLPSFQLPANTRVFLWAGFIQQIGENDFFQALDMAGKALKQDLKAVFVFAFKPEACRSHYRRYHRPEQGIYIIATSPDEFRYWQKRADVFYSPLWNRRAIITPPLTWLEMLNLGKPILTLLVPGAEDVITQGVNGFAARDEKELLACMFMLAEKERGMAVQCRQKIAADYNISRIAGQYLALWIGRRE